MTKVATNIEQSKKLAKILPIKSADMCWFHTSAGLTLSAHCTKELIEGLNSRHVENYPAWSLPSLLNVLNSNPKVYIPMLFFYEDKWVLQFVEYGHGIVEEVTALEQVDACVEMINLIKERNLYDFRRKG